MACVTRAEYYAAVRYSQMFHEPGKAYRAFCLSLASIIIASSLLSLGVWVSGGAPVFLPYNRILVEDGVAGKDFQLRYLLAKARREGYSPYGPVPAGYASIPVYPPFTYWFYSLFLDLGYARFYRLHNAVQVLAVLGAAAWVLATAGAAEMLLPVLVLLAAAMLVTPVGLIELERGQFELYLTAAYMLAYALLFRGGAARAALAGLLASFKFSSVTFLGPFLAVACLFHREYRRHAAVLCGVMALLLLLFLPDLYAFGLALMAHEAGPGSMGISFARIMPFTFSKFVILIVTGVFAALFALRVPRHCRHAALLDASFPFALCLLLQAAAYGTLAFEYRNVTLVSLVPGLLLWLGHVKGKPGLGPLCAGAYAVILFVCLRVVSMPPWSLFGSVSEVRQTWFMLLASLCMLAIAIRIVWLQKPALQEVSTAAV